ncbi:MAG: hypothetical protein EXR69_05335 [Myxococcales bacterium]|nr:hypothetical protein [Myxococcales bacterium]
MCAPFTDAMAVNFKNDTRAPLLILAGSEDRTVPAAMNRANFARYQGSKATTDFHEFTGRTHWTLAQPGWESVADHALDWAEKHLPA